MDVCFQKLSLLPCVFSAFHILRSCLTACKVMFLLRTLTYEVAERVSEETQKKMASALNAMLDVTLDPHQWALARLPVKRGGLGILDPKLIAAAAHVSSFLVSSVGAQTFQLPRCKVPFPFFRAVALLETSSPGTAAALRVLLHPGSPLRGDREKFELYQTSIFGRRRTTISSRASSTRVFLGGDGR